jgi:hypothetical protein
MTLRKRLERLESSGPVGRVTEAVFFTLHGMIDADVISIGNAARLVERMAGETVEDLKARAVASLAPVAVGLPLILRCHYSEGARERCEA